MKVFGLLLGLAAEAAGSPAVPVVHYDLADLLEEKLMSRSIAEPPMPPSMALLQAEAKMDAVTLLAGGAAAVPTPTSPTHPDHVASLGQYDAMISAFSGNLADATWALWKQTCAENSPAPTGTPNLVKECMADLDQITDDSIENLKSAILAGIDTEVGGSDQSVF